MPEWRIEHFVKRRRGTMGGLVAIARGKSPAGAVLRRQGHCADMGREHR